jgi:hypothetical protein
MCDCLKGIYTIGAKLPGYGYQILLRVLIVIAVS